MVISREREREETSKLVILCWLDYQHNGHQHKERESNQAGDIMWVRLPAPHIMVISRERESRRDKQASDIMWVRLPAPT